MAPTLSGLVIALAVLAAAAFWYDSMRVRESANRIAAGACRRSGLQLLDGTVSLTARRLRLGHHGLVLERTYVFEYTADGVIRSSGFIIMRGHRIQHVGLNREC